MKDLRLTLETVKWTEYKLNPETTRIIGEVRISVNGIEQVLLTDNYYDKYDETNSRINRKEHQKQLMVDHLNRQIANIFLYNQKLI